jgi:hypothetical protein
MYEIKFYCGYPNVAAFRIYVEQERNVTVAFDLPKSERKVLAHSPDKNPQESIATQFKTKDALMKSFELYKLKLSVSSQNQLNKFIEEFDAKEKKAFSDKQEIDEKRRESQKNYDEGKVNNEFMCSIEHKVLYSGSFRDNTPYVCGRCRVEKDGWFSPYNIEPELVYKCNDFKSIFNQIKCVKCNDVGGNSLIKNQLSAYKLICKVFSLNYGFTEQIYQFFDVKTAAGNVEFIPSKVNTIDYRKWGVANDAFLLDIHINTDPSYDLVERHGNSNFYERDNFDKVIRYWPVYVPSRKKEPTPHARISVTWVEKDTFNQNKSMLDMLWGLRQKDQNAFIMGANRSIEKLALEICKTEFIDEADSLTKINEIQDDLTSSINYRNQLKYILPLIFKAYGYTYIDDEIFLKIDDIRKCRNCIAHHGAILTKKKKDRIFSASDFSSLSSATIVVYAIFTQVLNDLKVK